MIRSSISKVPPRGVCQPSRRRRNLRCLNAQRGNLAGILLAFGVPGIVRGLRAHPDARRRTICRAEPPRRKPVSPDAFKSDENDGFILFFINLHQTSKL